MDAVKYLQERNRMTNDCGIDCWDCPLSKNKTKANLDCHRFEHKNPEKAIAIVEQWAKEHPVKTYLSVLLEKFPNVPLINNNQPKFCPNVLFNIDRNGCPKIEKNDVRTMSCAECWNRECKED